MTNNLRINTEVIDVSDDESDAAFHTPRTGSPSIDERARFFVSKKRGTKAKRFQVVSSADCTLDDNDVMRRNQAEASALEATANRCLISGIGMGLAAWGVMGVLGTLIPPVGATIMITVGMAVGAFLCVYAFYLGMQSKKVAQKGVFEHEDVEPVSERPRSFCARMCDALR